METTTTTTTTTGAGAGTASLTHRDRAVLRAVAAGRCVLAGPTLLVDDRCCADQFVYARLARAGLVGSGPAGPARLTPAGRDALAAA